MTADGIQITACPECGAPAEVERRAVLDSTDGPIEHVKVVCVRRHWYFLPVAALCVDAAQAPRRRRAVQA